MQIKAGIVGGAGYTGGELIRLLIHHPNVSLSFINSRSNAGKPIYTVHEDLIGDTDLLFTDSPSNGGGWGEADVLFLCVGHSEARKFLEANTIDEKVKNH